VVRGQSENEDFRACRIVSIGPVPLVHCSLAYSALACLRIGMSLSASFQSVRKSW